MANIAPPLATKLFLLFLLLSTGSPPPLAHSLSYSQFRTLVSLCHSLLEGVADLRVSRGDVSGSARARIIAEKLERGLGLGFLGMTWSLGWDYLRNYAWREWDYGEMHAAVSDVDELMGFVAELTRAESDLERAASVARNYGNVLRVTKRMLRRLLKVFAKSGALREVIETVQVEVVEGGLLMDCLELGCKDLKSLLPILKELALQFYSSPYTSQEL